MVRFVATFVHAWHGWVMKKNTLGLVAIFAPVLLGASTAIAGPASHVCNVQHVKWIGELQTILSLRAVEIVTSMRSGIHVRLQQMVAPSATLSAQSDAVRRQKRPLVCYRPPR